MAEIDLKAYTSRAKELETAIYTQKKLMEVHEAIHKDQHPIMPIKRVIQEPKKPEYPFPAKTETPPGYYFMLFLMVLSGIGGIIALFKGALFRALIGIGMGICGGICIYTQLSEEKQQEIIHQNLVRAYNEQRDEYPKHLEKYNQDVEKRDADYQKAMVIYNGEVKAYNSDFTALMKKHSEALSSLETALSTLYEENIVFPKYRNMVAITTINEYLMSGRCYELEGPNGAYNLYEMELRQNIIIGQLSSVVSNLEQIRNNQYSLYHEIVHANDTVDQIAYELRSLNKSSKLTAYFAGISAKIAASPKYIVGHIY